MIDLEKIIRQKLFQQKVHSTKMEKDHLWDSIEKELVSAPRSTYETIFLKAFNSKLFKRSMAAMFFSLTAIASSYFIFNSSNSAENRTTGVTEKETVNQNERKALDRNEPSNTSKTESTQEKQTSVYETKATRITNESITHEITDNPSPSIENQSREKAIFESDRTDQKDVILENTIQIASLMENDQTSLILKTLNPKMIKSNYPNEILGTAIFEEKVSVFSSFNVRIFASTTWSDFNYLDSEHSELSQFNSYIKGDWSLGAGCMVEFSALSQSWGVGLGWNEYIHRLDYEHEETSITTLQNQLISVDINAITGDTVQFSYGSVDITQTSLRRVIHHNRFHSISIPIEWQKSFLRNRFSCGIGVGVLAQIRSNASGRAFEEFGIISDYGNENVSSLKLYLLPTLRTYMSYQFAPTWNIDISSRFGVQNYSSRDWSELSTSNSPAWDGRLLLGNVELGLKHQFFYKRN